MKMQEIRKCKQCGKEFTAIRATHIYCSRSCRLEGNYNGVRKAYKRLYEERKQNGLCVYCGMLTESGFYCSACKEKEKIRHQKAYQKRKAKKGTEKRTDETKQQNEWLCVHCGTPVENGCLMCRKCQEVATGIQQKKGRTQKAKNLANIISNIERYNSEHGTRLSYGKYIAMKEMGKIV